MLWKSMLLIFSDCLIIVINYLHKNSQTVKKVQALAKKKQNEKVVKSNMAAQKWLWWSDNGKIFNNNNLGEFVLPPPTGNQHQNAPELLLLKILPLSDYHSHFWVATFLFSCCLFCMGRTFLQFGCFCVDFISFCNLTCIFAFTGYS